MEIPAAKKTFKLLKGGALLGDGSRIWEDGESRSIDLTFVVTRHNYFKLKIYLGLPIETEYTALRFTKSKCKHIFA